MKTTAIPNVEVEKFHGFVEVKNKSTTKSKSMS